MNFAKLYLILNPRKGEHNGKDEENVKVLRCLEQSNNSKVRSRI